MYNILVCDDDREIVDAIEIYLAQRGFAYIRLMTERKRLTY